MYKLKTIANKQFVVITKDDLIITIPFDPANTDYQAYLKFLEDGGTPLPADE
jgi:hypothetical protein